MWNLNNININIQIIQNNLNKENEKCNTLIGVTRENIHVFWQLILMKKNLNVHVVNSQLDITHIKIEF